MKRYYNCIFLFAGMCMLCLVTAVSMRRLNIWEQELAAREEALNEREKAIQELEQNIPAANRNEIQHELQDTPVQKAEYYLICEEGFLLVYQREMENTCLYTHIPITDLPAEEQEKIREGMGFSSMMEVMNYLESVTS